MPIFNRTVVCKSETFNFASIDGEHWLPTSRPIVEGDEEQFQRKLDGDRNFKPMTFTTGVVDWLERSDS